MGGAIKMGSCVVMTPKINSACAKALPIDVPDNIRYICIMKSIEVVAAIIQDGDRIFATQRGYGDFKDWWEFPGGKMEAGETPQDALIREIREELSAEIRVGKLLHTVEWDYPQFHLTMHCFMCTLVHDALHLNEHEAAKWLDLPSLHSVKWLPADEILLPMIEVELL